jgi:HEAT repeat protein
MIMVLMIVMGMKAPAQSSERSVQAPQPFRDLSASTVELRMKAVAELERKANEDLSVLDGASAPEAVVALLEAENKAIAERTAANGLVDPAPDVRLLAIFAVASAKDKGAIPLLERIAQDDPDTHTGRYSVRTQAAEALRRLR